MWAATWKTISAKLKNVWGATPIMEQMNPKHDHVYWRRNLWHEALLTMAVQFTIQSIRRDMAIAFPNTAQGSGHGSTRLVPVPDQVMVPPEGAVWIWYNSLPSISQSWIELKLEIKHASPNVTGCMWLYWEIRHPWRKNESSGSIIITRSKMAASSMYYRLAGWKHCSGTIHWWFYITKRADLFSPCSKWLEDNIQYAKKLGSADETYDTHISPVDLKTMYALNKVKNSCFNKNVGPSVFRHNNLYKQMSIACTQAQCKLGYCNKVGHNTN